MTRIYGPKTIILAWNHRLVYCQHETHFIQLFFLIRLYSIFLSIYSMKCACCSSGMSEFTCLCWPIDYHSISHKHPLSNDIFLRFYSIASIHYCGRTLTVAFKQVTKSIQLSLITISQKQVKTAVWSFWRSTEGHLRREISHRLCVTLREVE